MLCVKVKWSRYGRPRTGFILSPRIFFSDKRCSKYFTLQDHQSHWCSVLPLQCAKFLSVLSLIMKDPKEFVVVLLRWEELFFSFSILLFIPDTPYILLKKKSHSTCWLSVPSLSVFLLHWITQNPCWWQVTSLHICSCDRWKIGFISYVWKVYRLNLTAEKSKQGYFSEFF